MINIEAIDFLNQLNEYGKIDYSDYSHLHDLLTSEEPEWEYGHEVDGYWEGDEFVVEDYWHVSNTSNHALARRRKAGSWEPLEN